LRLVPFVSLAYHENDSLTRSLFNAAQVAIDAGVITQNEHTNWVDEINLSLTNGCFSASIVYFIVVGEK
jgi:hypothetical protein